MINKSGVYKITNKINGKFYYGSTTKTFKYRWNKHKSGLNKDIHDNKYLQNAWNKYGEDNFIFEIILVCDPENCLYYEQLFLDKYWDNNVNCYNICRTAGNTLGLKCSEETKAKMSQAKIGNKNSLGIKRSDETKSKMSKAQIGMKRSDETKAKISKTMKGNKNSLGFKHSDETKAKISKAAYRRHKD